MKYYKFVEKFVQDSFKENFGKTSKYSIRTAYWAKQIYPEADEAFLTAAVAHDIERALRKKQKHQIGAQKSKELKHHQEQGAKIISEFLHKNGAKKEFIDRVKMLVRKHEVGGNEEQNILKDADSISFFENINEFLDIMIDKKDYLVLKEKIDWMFNRITSKKAQQIARPWYEIGLKRLENI